MSFMIPKTKNEIMKVLILPLLICSLLVTGSCQSNYFHSREVDRIIFYPMPKGVERPFAIVSFFDFLPGTRDTVITDRKEIDQFCRLLNCLKAKQTLDYIDIRCAAVLKMKSGGEQCFCFGYTTGIQYNGCMSMEDSQPLFDYIDNHIYSTKDPDYWYDNKTKELIKKCRDDQFESK